MKTLLVLLTIFLAPKAFSQLNDVFQPKSWEQKKEKAAKPQRVYKIINDATRVVNDTTDATGDKSVLRLKLTPEYKGNNGKGADIYAMQPYNMPALVPDSTFHSRMPVKGAATTSKPKW